MDDLMKMPCSECAGKLRRKTISQEFEREGVIVKISGIKAWVCSQCGEIYFEPGGADKFSQAVNCLFALALAESQHKGKLRARVS
ncbi:MAG: YgiT-type zinc finger protein [Acidobacteriota bacterium]